MTDVVQWTWDHHQNALDLILVELGEVEDLATEEEEILYTVGILVESRVTEGSLTIVGLVEEEHEVEVAHHAAKHRSHNVYIRPCTVSTI